MSKNFPTDHEVGKAAERHIKYLLEQTGKYDDVKLIKGEHEEKDIVATMKTGRKLRIESKLILYSLKSKKVSIEFEYKGKPSGIEATQSDWWAITTFTHNGKWEVIFVQTEELIGMCKDNWRNWPVKKGGDYNASKFYIIPTEEFEELGYFIPNVAKFLPVIDEFQEKLTKIAEEKLSF